MISNARPLLHVITDETLQSRFDHLELARLARAGGADVIQLREKRARPTRRLIEHARAIQEALDGSTVRLIVDDRVDVAAASGAAGVHLGEQDLDPRVARRLLGDAAWIGATANDLDTARRVDLLPIDYIGAGPVFATSSKERPAPALGVHGLRRIVDSVRRPVVAIGGLQAKELASVLDTGVSGIAVLSCVVCAADPRRAVSGLRRSIEDWWNRKGETDASRERSRA